MDKYLLKNFEPDYSFDNIEILLRGEFIFQKITYPHCHDFYEITLVEAGNSIHAVNDNFVPISRGCMTFIRPDDRHCYMGYKSESYSMFNIRISCELLFELCGFLNADISGLLDSELPMNVYLNESAFGFYSSRLNSLRFMQPSQSRGIQMRTLLCSMIGEFLSVDPAENRMPEWFKNILEMISKNYCEDIDLNALARSCGVSREHMSRSFRKYLNVTPSQYINSLKIRFASHMLLYTEKEIIDIAGEAGFNNISYFYRLFGEYFKTTPHEYRAANRAAHAEI